MDLTNNITYLNRTSLHRTLLIMDLDLLLSLEVVRITKQIDLFVKSVVRQVIKLLTATIGWTLPIKTRILPQSWLLWPQLQMHLSQTIQILGLLIQEPMITSLLTSTISLSNPSTRNQSKSQLGVVKTFLSITQVTLLFILNIINFFSKMCYMCLELL